MTVYQWCGGVVVWWCGGVVAWWRGGVVVWWCGGRADPVVVRVVTFRCDHLVYVWWC